MRNVAALLAASLATLAAASAPRPAVPAARQAGAHRGAVRARRADRHPGARHRAEDGRIAWRLGGGGEQARRLDRDRRARSAEGGARRPHPALHHRHPRADSAPLQGAAVGCVQGLHADHRRRQVGDHPHGARLAALQLDPRPGGLRQGQPGQAQLRFLRRRLHLAPERRAVQAARRHRHRARALQRQRRRDAGTPGRRDADLLRRPDHRDRQFQVPEG